MCCRVNSSENKVLSLVLFSRPEFGFHSIIDDYHFITETRKKELVLVGRDARCAHTRRARHNDVTMQQKIKHGGPLRCRNYRQFGCWSADSALL